MSYAFKISVVISAYITVSIIGAYFIKLMLRRYEEVETNGGLRGAGMDIGIVERVMVLTFVLVDQYTAILASITFALFVGIVVRVILMGGV